MACMGLLCVLNGLESRQKILMGFNFLFIFLFFFRLGHDLGCHLGPNLVGLNKACRAPQKKNPFNNWAGSGLRV